MLDEKSYSLITSRNLRRLIFEKQVEQKDVAKALGVSQSIVSSWVNGTRTPKMKNIDALCRYFNCKRSDIIKAGNSCPLLFSFSPGFIYSLQCPPGSAF